MQNAQRQYHPNKLFCQLRFCLAQRYTTHFTYSSSLIELDKCAWREVSSCFKATYRTDGCFNSEVSGITKLDKNPGFIYSRWEQEVYNKYFLGTIIFLLHVKKIWCHHTILFLAVGHLCVALMSFLQVLLTGIQWATISIHRGLSPAPYRL